MAGEGSELNYLALQDLCDEARMIQVNNTRVARDARAKSFVLNAGAAWARQEFLSRLEGEGAHSDMLSVNIARDEQEYDQRTFQHHASPRTYSDLLYKNTLYNKARTVFSGLILVDDPLHDIDENPSSSLSRWRMLSAEDRENLDDDEVAFRGRPDTRDAHAPLGLIAVHASQEILRWLDADRDWEALHREMDTSWRSRSIEFPGVTARLMHQAEARYRRTANVIGVLRGSDPELSEEYVLIGGHMDHVGKDEKSGDIYKHRGILVSTGVN